MGTIFMQSRLAKTLLALFLVISSFNFSYSQNAIVTENLLPGTSQSIWDPMADGGVIEGFAQEFSVNKGDSVRFKIEIATSDPEPYFVKIYRLGWYQGNGARLIADLGNSLVGSLQPPPLYDVATGKTDCSNWSVSARWKVPVDAVSGVYIAKLECPGMGGSTILLFVVRDDASNSSALFKTSDATWQAYNPYGGNNFYTAATPIPGYTHATKVSYQRPVHLRGDKSCFFNAEYPMIRWMEKNGYDVSYTTDMDMARDPSVITPSIHKTLLSVGHDEYWSKEQFDKFETARSNGVHLAFFSGNEVYWKTRWEDNFQTLVCYKEGTQGENVCGGKCDPLPNVWTGLWRDGCAPGYASNDGCRPEGSLTGQMSWAQSTASIKVPDLYKNLRFWKNTSIANLAAGQTATLPYGTLGNEWDPEQLTTTYPSHRIVLSNTSELGRLHKMSLYRHSSGAFVFGAGTMQWSWGLDNNHGINTATPPVQPVSTDMQQATMNLLFDMGLTPGSPEAGLIVPTVLNDILAPASTINFPIHSTVVPGSPIIISGTSIDFGGGAVGGVEVSTDNGATWNNATGLENWTYTFSPGGYGSITIKVRAWDDFGNVEASGIVPSANAISISLTGPFSYSVFNSTYPQAAPVFFTGNPVELGMKFKSVIPGIITGFRYYKAANITGVHIGHLWDRSGNLLASETFTNETASGWQYVALTNPVTIAANTTYVVSYFSTSGEFTKEDPSFAQAIVNGFLRGLANGEDGGNGVYAYSASPSFPDNNYGSSNYFADVVFQSNDMTGPSVLSVVPANNATGVLLNARPTATLNEDINPTSVTRSSVVVTGPGGALVAGSVSLINGSVITFTPLSQLAINTTYTVTLKGGITEPVIKDLIGNPLPANYVWSFTTGNLSVPVVATKPLSQSVCANSIVTFTSAATGIPTPSVQWQVNENNGSGWTNIAGATSQTYTLAALPSYNNNDYRAVWSNSQGVENSAAATLTVSAEITGQLQAVDANICPRDPVQLVLSAASGPAPYSLIVNSNLYEGITVGVSFRPVLSSENIWSPTDLPAQLIQPDNGSIEVGVKFQANKNGEVKGIRFFKGGSANGGTHVGSLWTRSGTLLARATFVNETSSGWQEVRFSAPVAVTANTTYVASYFLPQGNYSRSGNYFATSGHSNGNSLNALQNTIAEPNGVYAYAGQSSFPDQDYAETNYWVDVVFAPYAEAGTTFNLTSITAANGCSATGNPISSASVTLGSTADAGTISGPATMCTGNTSSYTSNGSIGGLWSSSNPVVASVDAATGLVTAQAAGSSDIKYSVTGCNGTFTASQTITIAPDANAGQISGDSPLCIGANAIYASTGDLGGVWSSSNTTVASVDVAGLVTAVADGTVNIIYTINTGCNAPVFSFKSLTVSPNANAGTISGALNLCIGATETYAGNGDAGGAWSSSNPAVASINPNGILTALSAGTTDLTYTISTGCNGPVSTNLSVTVLPNANAGMITGASSLCIGSTSTFVTTGDPGGTWASSNANVAVVSAAGIVTAISAGTTDITYSLSSGCNAPVSTNATLTVLPNANAGTIFSGSGSLCTGSVMTFTSNGDAGGNWSSSNTAVASINAAGEMVALNAGTTNIIYTVNAGCNSPVSSQATIAVNNPATITSILGSSLLCINATYPFTVDGTSGGTWSSSNSSVASISSNGMVTASAPGTATITYSVTGCGGMVTGDYIVTVQPNANAGIISGSLALCIGSISPFTSNGDAAGTWSSSNPAIASVNTSGQVTTLSAGTTNIIYTITTGCASPMSTSRLLTVTANVIAGAITGPSVVCIGTATGYTSSGNSGGSWSSSNTAVASINSGGMLTALLAGSVNIIYTVNGCGGPVSSFISVTVNPNANAGTLSGTTPLCVGSSSTYTSSGNSGGTWTSSNPGVATISATGMVTALSAGTTIITYKVTAGCNAPLSSTKTLTVTANANPGTLSGASALCIGASVTYTSNGTPGGTWASNNPLVATVTVGGVVTGVTSGTSTISYTVTGCGGAVSSTRIVTIGSNANAGSINGNSLLCIGATSALSTTGNPGGSWSSSNTAIATVNNSGVVTALAAGSTTIIYKITSGCNAPVSASKILSVNPNATAGVISGASPLCIGAVSSYSSNGNTGGTWTSSNPSVASVSAAGLVKGLSAGTTTITYRINTGCNSPVSSIKVLTVGQTGSAGTITGTSPLCIGTTVTYTSNGTQGGVWSSSNPAVASVAANGSVKALSAGTTNIVYTLNSNCGGQVTSASTLTVKPNANAGIVTGSTPSCSFQTSLFTSNGDPGGTWSSSNPWVAYVWPTGHVTALFLGTANVVYTVNTGCNAPVSAYKTISINLFPYAGIVNGNSPVCAGTSTPYTSNGSAGGIWTSSNPSVATVNASSGVVTAVNGGTAVINYSVRACTGNASASKTITVTPLTPVTAGTVSGISPLCINAVTTYTTDGTTGGTWSSSSPSVASVNATTGSVKALSPGTTNIIYTKTRACGAPVTALKILRVNNCYGFAAGGGNTESTNTLKIGAYPNPSTSDFHIVLSDYGNDKISVIISDVLGNRVYYKEGPAEKKYTVGRDFKSGVYILQVMQGKNKQTLKLVKE